MCTQRVDDLRKSDHRLGTIAATIVQQYDVSFICLPQNAVDNVLCRDGLASAQAPIVGVDALAHNQITHLLSQGKLRYFLCILGLMIDAIGGTEEDGLDAEGAFNQTLCQIQFPADLRVRNLVELRMGKSVIPD